MVAFGEGFFQAAQNVVERNDRFEFEERAEENHVVALGISELDSSIHSVDFDDIDVGARGVVVNAVRVVDEGTSGLDMIFKFVEALLVENNGGIVGVDDRR